MFSALGAVIAAGGLAAAEVGTSGSHGEAVSAPSKLDYMVLASFVNSPHLLSMASYRSTGRQGLFMSDGKFAPNRKAGAAAGLPGVPPASGVVRP